MHNFPMEADLNNLDLFLEMDIALAAILPHKDAVIALAADRLAEATGMDYCDLKASLLDREKLGSTAIGAGVAMPHAMAALCQRPACALISLATPVNFDAPDDRDVDVVMALIWPQNRAQEFLKLSSSINRILTDPSMLQLIRRAGPADPIRYGFHARAQALRHRKSEADDSSAGDVMRWSSLSSRSGSDRPAASG